MAELRNLQAFKNKVGTFIPVVLHHTTEMYVAGYIYIAVPALVALSLCPLTLRASRVQSEIWCCRCQAEPPVLPRLQMFLQELLRFIIQDEGQVSSTSLTPLLGTEEGSLQIYKLITGAVESFLVLWAGESLCVHFSRTTSPGQ